MFYIGHVVLNTNVTFGKHKNKVMYKFINHKKDDKKYVIKYKNKDNRNTKNVYVVAVNSGETYNNDTIILTLERVIGYVGSKQGEYNFLLYKYNMVNFKKLENEPKEYFQNILEKELQTRSTIKSIFTIDESKTLDYDDGFSVTMSGEKITIGVHIADVSVFLKDSVKTNNSAKERWTSVYPNQHDTINMLPKYLSEDLCSLKENTKKLTVSVYFTYENDNETVSLKRDSVYIQKNYTYSEAKKQIKCSKDLFILDKIACSNKNTYKMVEYWMIKTNQYIAEKLKEHNMILRVQENKNEKLSHNSMISDNDITLYSIVSRNSANYVYLSKWSDYNHDLHSHTSLNKDYYTHFTSPIRRYADIMVHKILFESWQDEEIINENLKNINEKNKLCNKLKYAEEKLSLTFKLENEWQQTNEHYYTIARVFSTEPTIDSKILVKISYHEEEYLLYVKQPRILKIFELVKLEIVPNPSSITLHKKLMIKIV